MDGQAKEKGKRTFRAFSLDRKSVSGGHIEWRRWTTKQIKIVLKFFKGSGCHFLAMKPRGRLRQSRVCRLAKFNHVLDLVLPRLDCCKTPSP